MKKQTVVSVVFNVSNISTYVTQQTVRNTKQKHDHPITNSIFHNAVLCQITLT